MGDPRLVAKQPSLSPTGSNSCPIDTACHYRHIRNGTSCAEPHGPINCPADITGEEIATATKLLEKACQKLQCIPAVPPQRITDLDNATRQLHQLSCILDSCTITASYEVSQAQKALLLLPRTERGSSTSSEEHCANLPELTHEDVLQEH